MFICVSSSTFPLLEEWERGREKQIPKFRHSMIPLKLWWIKLFQFFRHIFFPLLFKWFRFVIVNCIVQLWVRICFHIEFQNQFRIKSVSFIGCNGIVSVYFYALFLSIYRHSRYEWRKKSILKYFQNWPKIRNNFTESKTVQRNGDAGCGDQCDHLWTDEETERDRQRYNSTTFIDANL